MKLGKQKFTFVGEHMDRTTFQGDIELQLHYDLQKDFFYFENDDIRKYLPKYDGASFAGCKSKDDAIAVFKMCLGLHTEHKRMLNVRFKMNGIEEKDNKAGSIHNLIDNFGGNNGIGISIEFERILEYTVGKSKVYGQCEDNWSPIISYGKMSTFSPHSGNGMALIEWDEHTEMFLVKMQQQLILMSDKIKAFFTVTDESQLKERIKSFPMNLLIESEKQ